MSRKERRALAHANSKNTTPPSVTVNITQEPVTAPVKPEISEAQLAANRANAQLSHRSQRGQPEKDLTN